MKHMTNSVDEFSQSLACCLLGFFARINARADVDTPSMSGKCIRNSDGGFEIEVVFLSGDDSYRHIKPAIIETSCLRL